MSVTIDGGRSRKWVSFAKKKLATLKDLDLPATALKVNGYLIRILALDDIEKISIKAPPGAIVVNRLGDNTNNTYEYRYSDQYGGDFSTLLSRPGAEGFVPLTAFSAVDDLVYLATADYSAPTNTRMAFAGSWYAPRPTIPADPATAPGGFIAGSIATDPANPTKRVLGMAFSRNGVLYMAATSDTSSVAYAKDVAFSAISAASQASVTFDVFSEYPEYRGKAFFIRPEWGADAAIIFAFHRGGACGGTLGAARVLIYYVQAAKSPFSITSATLAGSVTQEAIAAALGLAVPCSGGDDGSGLTTALSDLLGANWPANPAPFKRGMFSYGPSGMCVWGPIGGAVKGLLLAFGNAAAVVSVTFPPHNDFALYPLTTEVSPGHYCCELWTTDGVSDTGEITGVYYGSPLTGSWVNLPHPPGVILRHRTVQATAAHTIALAVMYNAGANETVLHEYDSRKSTEWRRRGKIGAGKVTRPSVALFGNHEYARMASTDSAVARLWD